MADAQPAVLPPSPRLSAAVAAADAAEASAAAAAAAAAKTAVTTNTPAPADTGAVVTAPVVVVPTPPAPPAPVFLAAAPTPTPQPAAPAPLPPATVVPLLPAPVLAVASPPSLLGLPPPVVVPAVAVPPVSAASVAKLRNEVEAKRRQAEALMGEVLGWATSLSQPLRNPHPLLAAVLTSTKVNAQLTTDQAAALTTRLPAGATLVETPMVHAARSAVRSAMLAAARQQPHDSVDTGHAGAGRAYSAVAAQPPERVDRPPRVIRRSDFSGPPSRPGRSHGVLSPTKVTPAAAYHMRPVPAGVGAAAGGAAKRRREESAADTAAGREPRMKMSQNIKTLTEAVKRAEALVEAVCKHAAANEAAAAAAGPKPSGETLLTVADRAKLEHDHTKRVIEVVTRQCMSVLKVLMAHKWGFPFNTPVDAAALGLVDYNLIVLQPMDLGTIKRRIEKGQYAHPDAVHPEMSLVFANAMRYNPPGSDVHVMASTLAELCNSKWAVVVTPKLVEVERTKQIKMLARIAEVERSPLNKKANHTVELHALLEDTARSLGELQRTLVNQAAPMAYHRKHQLHLMLKQLPAARMAEAVAVLSKCDPTVARTRAGQHTQPGGWAMDLDRLHAFTLRQLERHAQVALGADMAQSMHARVPLLRVQPGEEAAPAEAKTQSMGGGVDEEEEEDEDKSDDGDGDGDGDDADGDADEKASGDEWKPGDADLPDVYSDEETAMHMQIEPLAV